MSSNLVVTSVQTTVFPRREISDLFGSPAVKDKAQVDLFLQAMVNVKKRDVSDPKSFFRIGAIHGAPYWPYNAQNESEEQGTGLGGYCFHGDTLFPTWHRPYIATIEQLIQEEARSIAEKYTPEATHNLYKEAANELRFPYWDWASDKTLKEGAPIYLTQPSVKVHSPQGDQTIDNPLLSYKLPAVALSGGLKPGSDTYRDHFQDWFKTPKTVKDLRTKVRNMFQTTQWYDFSNHRNGDKNAIPKNPRGAVEGVEYASSLESVHDSVHGDIGGTMGIVATSGFDPIFYLHHCNVDRLFAIWQAINPNTYVESTDAKRGTFYIKVGELLTEKTPLKPFVINQRGDYWTSADCRDTRRLGYTYKDIDAKVSPTDLYDTMLKQYGAEKNLTKNAIKNNPTLQTPSIVNKQIPIPAPQIAHQQLLVSVPTLQTSAIADQQPPTPTLPHIENEHLEGYREWYTAIEVQKNIRNGPFSIYVFVGDVPDDYNKWRESPSYAGRIYSFSRPIDTECANCQKRPTLTIVGMVELTEAMMQNDISLFNGDDRNTINILREKLKYRVYDHENEKIIDAATIPTMTARVYTAAVRFNDNHIIEKSDWAQVEELAVN